MYLGEKYAVGDKSFIYPSGPENLKLRAKINQRLIFNGGVLFDAVAKAFVPIAFRGQKTVDEAAVKKIKEVLGFFQLFIKDTGFIAGTEKPTLADFALLASFTTMETTQKAFVDFSEFPELQTWKEKVKAYVPNYEEVNNKGVKVFENFFRERTGLI